MNEIPVTALSTPILKSSSFEFGNQLRSFLGIPCPLYTTAAALCQAPMVDHDIERR